MGDISFIAGKDSAPVRCNTVDISDKQVDLRLKVALIIKMFPLLSTPLLHKPQEAQSSHAKVGKEEKSG